MHIICKQLNPYSCKTYLVKMEGSNEVVFIDPVIEHVNDYVRLVKEERYVVSKVIDTHSHADHISGASALKDLFDCDYMMHANAPSQCVNFRVNDGFEWKLFNKVPVRILYTPGHTRDSISLIVSEYLFTGDALFLDDGGAGRDDLPGGSPEEHWETMQKYHLLPDNLVVYPAHDYRNRTPSSLKQQKQTNPHLEKCLEGLEAFMEYITDLRLGPAEWMKEVLKANYACARDPKAAWIPVDSPACEVKGSIAPGANEINAATIIPEVLKQKLDSQEEIVLIDVREEDELTGPLGHLQSIIHIPIASLAARISEQEMEKYRDKEIVTICRSGARAHTAAQILVLAGFSSVSVLAGGMVAWNSYKKQTE